jgi:hypothetical protein
MAKEIKQIDEARLGASFRMAKEPHASPELRKAEEDLLA